LGATASLVSINLTNIGLIPTSLSEVLAAIYENVYIQNFQLNITDNRLGVPGFKTKKKQEKRKSDSMFSFFFVQELVFWHLLLKRSTTSPLWTFPTTNLVRSETFFFDSLASSHISHFSFYSFFFFSQVMMAFLLWPKDSLTTTVSRSWSSPRTSRCVFFPPKSLIYFVLTFFFFFFDAQNRTKNRQGAIEAVIGLLNSDCPLESLGLAGGRGSELRTDALPFLYAVATNDTLTELVFTYIFLFSFSHGLSLLFPFFHFVSFRTSAEIRWERKERVLWERLSKRTKSWRHSSGTIT
jgi:hypothetical protein